MTDLQRNANFRNLLSKIEEHNPSRKGHGDRVAVYAVGIAQHMGESDLLSLRLAAMIHDAPKLAMSQEVLESDGPWQDAQFIALSNARNDFALPFDDVDANAIERLVREQDSPTGSRASRILHVAVAFDTMTHPQPWRKAMTEGEAIALMREIPSRFLPEAVDALEAVAPLIQPVESI